MFDPHAPDLVTYRPLFDVPGSDHVTFHPMFDVHAPDLVTFRSLFDLHASDLVTLHSMFDVRSSDLVTPRALQIQRKPKQVSQLNKAAVNKVVQVMTDAIQDTRYFQRDLFLREQVVHG